MRVAIVNYGMGNLASVQKAVETIGHAPQIADRPDELNGADSIILPGVGAFGEGMDRLDQGGWSDAIRNRVKDGTPLLGICLGMQFLAERGTEGHERDGLGLIAGKVVSLRGLGCTERVPHVGWNETRTRRADPLLQGLPPSMDYYYVHSFAFSAADAEDVLASVEYGCDVTAIVRHGGVWGTQFHPEKSSKAGLQLLRNFIERAEC